MTIKSILHTGFVATVITMIKGCAVYMAADGTAGGRPSAERATAHAALDVVTLGLWELIGTPAELVIQKNQDNQQVGHKSVATAEDTYIVVPMAAD